MNIMITVGIFVAVVMFFRDQKGDSGRGIDGIFIPENIFHKILQAGTGDHEQVCCFRGFNLPYIQCVVVQAGNLLCYQTGHSQRCSLADPGGKFPYR